MAAEMAAAERAAEERMMAERAAAAAAALQWAAPTTTSEMLSSLLEVGKEAAGCGDSSTFLIHPLSIAAHPPAANQSWMPLSAVTHDGMGGLTPSPAKASQGIIRLAQPLSSHGDDEWIVCGSRDVSPPALAPAPMPPSSSSLQRPVPAPPPSSPRPPRPPRPPPPPTYKLAPPPLPTHNRSPPRARSRSPPPPPRSISWGGGSTQAADDYDADGTTTAKEEEPLSKEALDDLIRRSNSFTGLLTEGERHVLRRNSPSAAEQIVEIEKLLSRSVSPVPRPNNAEDENEQQPQQPHPQRRAAPRVVNRYSSPDARRKAHLDANATRFDSRRGSMAGSERAASPASKPSRGRAAAATKHGRFLLC